LRRTAIFALVTAAAAVGCNTGIDPESTLRLAWPGPEVRIAQDSVDSVTVVLTRTHGYEGDLKVRVEGVPAGVSATVADRTEGIVTTAVVRLRVNGGVAVGLYQLTLIVQGDRLLDISRKLNLFVLAPPKFSVSPAPAAYSAIRGGSVPLKVGIQRTNFGEPVELSYTAPPGVSIVFSVNPTTGNEATGMVSVAPGTAPGTHTVTIHAAGPPLPAASAPFTLTVTNDDLQVVADSAVGARQGAITRRALVVNKIDPAAVVTLVAEGLPAGVTAGFVADTGLTHVMALNVAPQVAPASYPVVVRASSPGLADATATVLLLVVPSFVTVVASPESLTVFQGKSGQATLTLTRTLLDTSVAISFDSVPPGVVVSANPASLPANASTMTVSVGATVPESTYNVVVLATPAGWPVSAAARRTLPLRVRAVPAGAGNVILDWSACGAPVWLAAQDGFGPWLRVTPVDGVFRFNVAATRGGFAYRPAMGDSLVVRYRSQAELVAQPIDMCPPAPPAKTVTGTGIHNFASEAFRYSLGGASATSTAATPDFALAGIHPGTHDFVAWATGTATGHRGWIQRDVDIADGESLGPVDLTVPGSFQATNATLFAGGFLAGESVSHSMSLLTTETCTSNLLYTSSTLISSAATMWGVPDSYRRLSDFHKVTLTASGPNRIRTATVVIDRIATRTASMITQIAAAGVTPLPGAFKRLQLSVSNYSAAYNGPVAFSYQAGKIVLIQPTIAYLAPFTTVFALVTPDLAGAAGWDPSFAPSANSTGSWSLGLEGGGTGSSCSVNYTRNTLTLFGTFQ